MLEGEPDQALLAAEPDQALLGFPDGQAWEPWREPAGAGDAVQAKESGMPSLPAMHVRTKDDRLLYTST